MKLHKRITLEVKSFGRLAKTDSESIKQVANTVVGGGEEVENLWRAEMSRWKHVPTQMAFSRRAERRIVWYKMCKVKCL